MAAPFKSNCAAYLTTSISRGRLAPLPGKVEVKGNGAHRSNETAVSMGYTCCSCFSEP